MVNRRTVIAGSVFGSVLASGAFPDPLHSQPKDAKAALGNDPNSLLTYGLKSILQLEETGRYLPVLDAAERLSRDNLTSLLGQAAECYGIMGEEHLALLNDERFSRVAPPPSDRRAAARVALANAEVLPAIDAIAERVKDRQIVIINEAHTTARHRVFTLALAVRLRTSGFKWFAAETLRPPISAFKPNSTFTRNMGWWTNEVTFAEVMRRVQSLGYHIAAYDYATSAEIISDDMAVRSRQREERAAHHLIDNILRKDPNARILIHVGYDHLSKDPRSLPEGWGPSFALRLKEITGIDPFCIDQVMGTPASGPELDRPYLSEVLIKYNPQEPVVIRTASDRGISQFEGRRVDEVVFHPRVVDISGRPGWRAAMPGVQLVPSDMRLAIRHQCRLVLAYRVQDEPNQAVPADILVLNPAKKTYAFILSPGQYRLKGERVEGFVDLGHMTVLG